MSILEGNYDEMDFEELRGEMARIAGEFSADPNNEDLLDQLLGLALFAEKAKNVENDKKIIF